VSNKDTYQLKETVEKLVIQI